MITDAPSPEASPPPERDDVDGILCDAIRDLIKRRAGGLLMVSHDSDDVEPLAAALRADLRRFGVELIALVPGAARRSDTVLVNVHTLALAQRNWALRLLDERAPEGVAFVAHLQQTHDARVAELLEANNREVARRRAAEAQLGHLASGMRKLIPDIGEQIARAMAALDGERSKLVDDFIAAVQEP